MNCGFSGFNLAGNLSIFFQLFSQIKNTNIFSLIEIYCLQWTQGCAQRNSVLFLVSPKAEF
jgi:hypothetical protein